VALRAIGLQRHVRRVRSLPLIWSTPSFPRMTGDIVTTIELIRSTEEEKNQQIRNAETFRANRNGFAPESLKRLQQTARDRQNVFAQLMEAVKYNSEGQISHALYDVGGEYRRNM
jgi:isobutyryl-CoA mutase